MNVLRRNLLANLAGTFWFGLLSVALVPVYVRLLGVEAFGLIAFQSTLTVLVALFDAGLTVTANRELARLSVTPDSGFEARVFTRTTEVIYWSIAVVLGAVLVASTPLIARHWLEAQSLSAEVTAQAIALAVIGTMLQFPYAFYAAGLLGLQQHVLLNTILCVTTTIRAAGAVLLLIGVARDVRLLFAWFIVASLFQTLAAAIALHKTLPAGRAHFDKSVLRNAFRFARGVAVSTTIGVLTTQIDKLVVSKLLPLSTFGWYSIAGMIAVAVGMAVTPVQTTVFPRLSQLVAQGDEKGKADAYHRATQTVAAILMPLTAVTTLFAYEIVLIWTQNADVARAARWVAVLLITGAALNALSHISHATQLAHGWTAPAVVANAIQLVAMVPLSIYAVRHYGAIGAAAMWAVMQLSFLVISLGVTHTRTLRGELGRLILHDVGPAFCASFGVAIVARFVLREGSREVLALSIAIIGALVLLAGALSTAVVREWLAAQWRLRASQQPR